MLKRARQIESLLSHLRARETKGGALVETSETNRMLAFAFASERNKRRRLMLKRVRQIECLLSHLRARETKGGDLC